MASDRAAQIMAAMRGDRTDEVVETPKLTGAAAEIARRLEGHNAGSVPPAKRSEESRAQFKKLAQDFALKHGLSRADAEAAAREFQRREAQDNQRRQAHEAMVRRNLAEPRRIAEAAVEAATRPRVKRLPNGDPVPGTTVNDLIQDAARDRGVEKLRVAALASYDDLVELGLVEPDEEQQESKDAALVAKLQAITGAVRSA